jgi:hypothetical protein
VQAAVGLAVLLPIVVVLVVADAVGATAAEVESSQWIQVGILQSAALAAVPTVLLAPTAGLVVATICCLVLGVVPAEAVGPHGPWLVSGVLLAVLLLVDGVLAVRRRARVRAVLAPGTARVAVPDLQDWVAGDVVRRGTGWLVLAVLLTLVGLGGVGVVVRDTRATADFRAQARTAQATVVEVAADDQSAQVEIDGRRYPVPLPATYRKVGDRVEVRYDPGSGRAELVDDVFDPTRATIPAVLCLMPAVVLVGRTRRRRAQTRRLLTGEWPAFRLRAEQAPRVLGAVLTPWDDVTRPLVTAPSLDLVHPFEVLWYDEDDVDLAWLDPNANDHGRGGWQVDDEGEDTGRGGEGAIRPDVSAIPDAELLRQARAGLVEGEAEVEPETSGPSVWHGSEVVVLGLTQDGGPLAVLDGERVWLTGRPALWPAWSWPLHRRRTAALPVAASEPTRLWDRYVDAQWSVTAGVGRRVGRWLPWLALPLLVWGSRSAAVELGARWQLASWATGLVPLAWTVSFWGAPRVRLVTDGLRVRGAMLTTHLPWVRITGVAADSGAVVVRYDDGMPGGGALLLPESVELPTLGEDGGPVALAARIDEQRRAAALNPPAPVPVRERRGPHGATDQSGLPPVRHRPAAPTVVAICWTLGWLVPILVP